METRDGLSKPEAAGSCENDSAGHERLFKFPSVGVGLFAIYVVCLQVTLISYVWFYQVVLVSRD